MDEGKEKLARSNFDKLKIDPSSAGFTEEILDKKLLLKLKNQSMLRTKNFLIL